MANSLRKTNAEETRAGSKERFQDKFQHFLQSLGDALNDITALEVNTMVVSQITGNKFVAEEAYRDIYMLTEERLSQEEVPLALHKRYKALRDRLEAEYRAAVGRPTAKLPDPIAEVRQVEELLLDGNFVRTLRKIKEIKAALHSSDPTSPFTDIIFAQTVLQLDGDIINRYHERLLTHTQRDLLLEIHTQGVTYGERQWRGVLEFMVTLMRSLVFGQDQSSTLLPWNGKKQSR